MTGIEKPADLSSPDREKTDREVFDRIQKKYADTPRRDDFTTPSETLAADPTPNAETPQLEEQAPSVETPAEAQEPTTARLDAERFLKLKTGSPDSVFAGMSDDAVLSWAEDRRTREANVDGVFSRAAMAEKELESLRAEATTPAEPTGPTVDERLAKANAVLDEEGSLTGDVRAALDTLIDLRVASVEDKFVQREERAQQERQKQTQRTVASAREELTKRFGQLADDTKFAAVFNDMERIEDSPLYGGSGKPIDEWLPRLMADTARNHGLDEHQGNEVEAARQAVEEERTERAAGIISTASQNAQPVKASREDMDRAVYDLIRKRSLQDRYAVG